MRGSTAERETSESSGASDGGGTARWIAPLRLAIGVVLLLAVVALAAGPGRGLRSDIARQRDLLESQLATTREQLELTTRQLELTTQQLAVTTEQLEIARTQLEIAQRQERITSEQLEIARQQLARTEESLAEQRQLRAIAEATLRQAQELNGKVPDLNPAA